MRTVIALALILAGGPALNVHARHQVVAAATSPTVVLIVDISSSMNENDGNGTIKIEGAKTALLNVIQGLPTTASVGLHPYPQDGNCGPGSTQAGLEPTSDALRQAIIGLTAHGNTPTGPALRAAAAEVLREDRRATMVLVSDGESNCGTDPCEVAKQIAAQNLEITVNTVGFRISSGGADELRCIADATGGRYFDARDSQALQQGVAEAATPRLSIVVDEPRPDEVIGAGSVVTIAATVRNISGQRLDDVRTLLSFPPAPAGQPGNLDPGVAGAIKYLGNLAANEARSVRWQYRVALSQDGTRSDLVVHATAANASPQKVALTLRYGDALDLLAAGPLLRQAKHPAILGDSYSSGEGAGGYHSESNIPDLNSCHRSDRTYAMSLWPTPPLLIACSGAITANIGGPNPANHEVAQTLRLAAEQVRTPVDLVLLTIGGNDIGFENIIRTCVLRSNCQDLRIVTNDDPVKAQRCMAYVMSTYTTIHLPGLGSAQDCEDASISYEAWVYGQIDRVGGRLRDAYEAVDATVNSPEALTGRNGRVAPIIVLAYPNLMPFYAKDRGFCSRLLSEAEVRFGAGVADRLNARIKQEVAAERAKGLPIYFAEDVQDALRPNHTICDAEPHAVREVLWRTATAIVENNSPLLMEQLLRQATGGVQQEQLHPTAEGYQDMTAALVRWSNRAEALQPVTRDRPNPYDPIPLGPDAGTLPLGENPNQTLLLQPGSTLTLQGSGYAPADAVEITVHSAPIGLGTAYADSQGRIHMPVLVPRDLAPGRHLVVATGLDATGRPIARYGFIEVRRPVRWIVWTLWAVAAVLVLPSVLVGLHRVRRRRSGLPG
jgi:hypothetical protein